MGFFVLRGEVCYNISMIYTENEMGKVIDFFWENLNFGIGFKFIDSDHNAINNNVIYHPAIFVCIYAVACKSKSISNKVI